jgi:hypothetical protein
MHDLIVAGVSFGGAAPARLHFSSRTRQTAAAIAAR